jgi:diaphanous 1
LKAIRRFRVCVPDEWYRRSVSKSHSLSSFSLDYGDTTIKQQQVDDDDEEDEDEGTAKAVTKYPPSAADRSTSSPTPTLSSDSSKNRLSSMFDSWLHSPSTASPSIPATPSSREDRRKSVSGPVLVESGGSLRLKSVQNVGLGLDGSESNTDEENCQSDSDIDPVDFENMMNELGLKGPQRQAMHQLPIDRKKYLLRQNRGLRSAGGNRPPVASPGPSTRSSPVTSSQTYGPATAGQLLPRLVPQLTGDSIMKRFSISAWGSGTSQPPTPAPAMKESVGDAEGASAQIVPQTTGGLWSSWWASSGGAKDAQDKSVAERGKSKGDSPEWYVDGIRNG